MKISLSKRERILIVGSLVAIILFVYMLLVLPRFKEKIEDQEGRLSVLRSQLTSREKAAARLSELQEETGVLEAYLAANLEDYFGTRLEQEDVLLLVRELVKDSGIVAYELSLDESGTSQLSSSLEHYYKQKQAEAGLGQTQLPADETEGLAAGLTGAGNEKTQEQTQDKDFGEKPSGSPTEGPGLIDGWTVPPLKMISVSIRFRSEYPAMMDFIRLISQHAKRIGIENLTLSGSGEGVEGTIRIFLPALEMVETYYPTPVPDLLEDNLDNRHKKADPFNYPDRYVEPQEPEPVPEETFEPGEDDSD